MLKIKDNHDEYIFTKRLDIEDLNTKMINRIESVRKTVKFNVKAETTFGDLHKYDEFREFSEIVEKFVIESSIKRNAEFPNHVERANHPVSIYTYNRQKTSALWAVKYQSGDSTEQHDHWPSTWAWTYYIDPPKGCSGLYFPNADYEIKIEHGLLVVFSGSIIHEVKPSTFDGYRYCITGTIDFEGYRGSLSKWIEDMPKSDREEYFNSVVSNPPQKTL